MVALIPLIEQILKLVNNLLEGTPVEIRQANATAWFFLWWPLMKRILSRSGLSEAELAQIEENVKGAGK